jgi:hypothetical protein
MERTASHCSSSSSLLIAGTAQQVARPGSAPSSRQAAGRRRSRRKAGAGAGMEAGHRGRGNGAAPSSFARISLISAMREASVSAANATATGRNDAAAAVPMAARRPSGRAGVCSAEAPANSVTARVVSMKRFGRQQAREEACTKGALKVELSRGGLIFVLTRRRCADTAHTHKWDGLHTRHLLESTHTTTHTNTNKHTTWPDKVRCGLTPWRRPPHQRRAPS